MDTNVALIKFEVTNLAQCHLAPGTFAKKTAHWLNLETRRYQLAAVDEDLSLLVHRPSTEIRSN